VERLAYRHRAELDQMRLDIFTDRRGFADARHRFLRGTAIALSHETDLGTRVSSVPPAVHDLATVTTTRGGSIARSRPPLESIASPLFDS